MLLNGAEIHVHSCPFHGMDKLAWDIAIDWYDAIQRQDPPVPYLQVPMWLVSALAVIRDFRQLQEATSAE